MKLKKMVLDAEERIKQELGRLWDKLHDPTVSADEKELIRIAIRKLEGDYRVETSAIRGLCKQ